MSKVPPLDLSFLLLPSLPAPVHGNLVILRAFKHSEKVDAIGKSLGDPYQKPSINPTPSIA
jgi:hypothetical protein